LKIAPSHPTLQYNLGHTCLFAGRPEQAVAPLRSVLADMPNYADARTTLAAAFYSLGEYDSARVHYERVLMNQPDIPVAQTGLGWSLLELAQYDSALTCLRRSVDLDYDVSNGYYNLAQIWMLKGNRDSALANLHRCAAVMEVTSPDGIVEIQSLIDSLQADQTHSPDTR
jgi:tetratricopeptide (TPR) repeat protein